MCFTNTGAITQQVMGGPHGCLCVGGGVKKGGGESSHIQSLPLV